MWETKKELRAELENAEKRVIAHWKRGNAAEAKLRRIATVIESAEQNKEVYAFTIEKIKKILVNDWQSNN